MKIDVTEPAEISVKSADDNLIWSNKNYPERHPESVHPPRNISERRKEVFLSAEDIEVP